MIMYLNFLMVKCYPKHEENINLKLVVVQQSQKKPVVVWLTLKFSLLRYRPENWLVLGSCSNCLRLDIDLLSFHIIINRIKCANVTCIVSS